jgi:hypothetical protein
MGRLRFTSCHITAIPTDLRLIQQPRVPELPRSKTVLLMGSDADWCEKSIAVISLSRTKNQCRIRTMDLVNAEPVRLFDMRK